MVLLLCCARESGLLFSLQSLNVGKVPSQRARSDPAILARIAGVRERARCRLVVERARPFLFFLKKDDEP
jgi:hypothetical protein